MKPKRGTFYKIEGEKAVLQRRHCPRCGPGVLLAEHQNRLACGKCGYTEFKK
jgi:small subunit ribosomal protein S27Ae